MTQHLKAGSVEGLVEKLEAAEVGSRELDEAIHDLLCDGKTRTCIAGLSDEEGGLWMYEFHDHSPHSALRVTTSLDAALALAERVLPGWEFGCYFDRMNIRGNRNAKVEAHRWQDVAPEYAFACASAKAETPALALCIAILKARLSLTLEGEG